MPPPIPVDLVPHDPRWSGLADTLAAPLKALAPVVDVHHIGSTAIPGIRAKPIIDLMPVVTCLEDLDAAADAVRALGYTWHGEYGMAGRRYCTRTGQEGVRIAQVHFFPSGSADVARHLAFRDYLRAHPDVAVAYDREKRRARDLHPADSHGYGQAKSGWIATVEAEAIEWAAGRSAFEN